MRLVNVAMLIMALMLMMMMFRTVMIMRSLGSSCKRGLVEPTRDVDGFLCRIDQSGIEQFCRIDLAMHHAFDRSSWVEPAQPRFQWDNVADQITFADQQSVGKGHLLHRLKLLVELEVRVDRIDRRHDGIEPQEMRHQRIVQQQLHDWRWIGETRCFDQNTAGGMMDAGQEITSADIKAALAKQNMSEDDIKPGDAIMFHTGWGSLWMKNNDRFNSGEPGIGLDAARWVIEKDLCLTAADT